MRNTVYDTDRAYRAVSEAPTYRVYDTSQRLYVSEESISIVTPNYTSIEHV